MNIETRNLAFGAAALSDTSRSFSSAREKMLYNLGVDSKLENVSEREANAGT